MPVYQITAPDGRKLRVTAPEGATQEDALAYAQQQLGFQPEESRQQKYERLLAELEARQPSGDSDSASVARQTFDASAWYEKPFIAAGAELTRIGRGVQQILTPSGSERGRQLQKQIDADAPYQDGVHGVAGFVGRALPYLATLPLGGPEAAVLSRARGVGKAAQIAVKGATAAAEGAGYGALGETRTGESRARNAAYGAAGGVVGRGVVGAAGGAAKAVARPADPVLREAVEVARREGIPLHISQVARSTPLKTAASVAKYSPFGGADKAAREQQDAWNYALTRHAGDGTTRLDDAWLASRKEAFNKAYDEIWSRNNVIVTPQAAQNMAKIVKDAYRDLGTEGGKVVENQFNRIMDDVLRAGKGGEISGRNYQVLASDLAGVQPDTPVGRFVGKLRAELIKAADASVAPGDMAAKRTLDKQYNNFKTLEKLLQRPAGAQADISPAALWAAVNARGPKATKEFRELAKVGQTLLKDRIPDSGTQGRIFSAGILTGGVPFGGFVPMLAALTASAAAGRALNSKTVGNLAARNAGKASTLARLLDADGKVGSARKAAGRAVTKAAISNSSQDRPLQIDIVGGNPGPGITQEELDALRRNAILNARP